MRTLTLEELGRELGDKEWTLESKHEYEAAILIEMEKATGFYEEDSEELTFTAGNRLKRDLVHYALLNLWYMELQSRMEFIQ